MYERIEKHYNVDAGQLRVGVTTVCNIAQKWTPSEVDVLSLVTVLLDSKISKSGLHASSQLNHFLRVIYERNELDCLSVSAWYNDGTNKHILDVLADLVELEIDLKEKNEEEKFWRCLFSYCGNTFVLVYKALKDNYDMLAEVRSWVIINKGEERK